MNDVGEKETRTEDGHTSFENIIKEVEDIFRNFQPIFIFLKGTEHETFFKQNLVSDFARIALVCGDADKTFDPMESIATIFVLGTLWNGQEFFSNVVLKWNELSKADREKYEGDLSKLFEGIREQNDKHLSTLSFVKEWDKYNGTSFFEIVSSTMECFAKLVVEADETVGSEEQGILKYIKLLIYDPKKAKLPNRATGDMANGILFGQFPCHKQTVIPLSFNEISHELILIYDGIQPLIHDSQKSGFGAVQSYLIQCFSRIALLLAEPENKLSPKKNLISFFMSISITRGKKFLLYDVPNWELHTILFKDALANFQDSLDAMVKEEFEINLSMWSEIDNKLGTDFLNALTTSLFSFAQLVVKVDGVVTPEEERKLKHVWNLIYEPEKSIGAQEILLGLANEKDTQETLKMQNKRPMKTLEIFEEVNRILKDVQDAQALLPNIPEWADIKEDLSKAFESTFLKIALIFRKAEQNFVLEELLAINFAVTGTEGMRTQDQKLLSAISVTAHNLDKSLMSLKEKTDGIRDILGDAFKQAEQQGVENLIIARSKFNKFSRELLEEETRNYIFEKLAAAFYQFAQLIAKVTGRVTPEDEKALKHVWNLIYEPEKAAEVKAMQNKNPMSALELFTEVSLIVKDAKDFLFDICGADDKKLKTFSSFLDCDFSKIALMCGKADKSFDCEEALVTYLAISGMYEGHEWLSNKGWDIVRNWDIIPLSEKESLRAGLSDIFETTARQELEDLAIQIFNKLEKEIVHCNLEKLATAYYRFAQLIVKADGTVTPEEEQTLKHVWELIHKESSTASDSDREVSQTIASATKSTKETLDEVFKHLNELIGMENIKSEVNTLTNFLKIQKERTDRGLSKTPLSLHAVFCGPPGTGKTTVARLLGKIYKQMGFLSKGHLVETDRSGLVAGYVGQTALKVDEIVNKALDGVLFIDEAYALKPENASSDFGQEAIDILLKRMEDNRDRLVVICAGYTDETMRFLEANPGVKSRFNRYFYFEDYKPDELLAIFETFCKECHFVLTDEAKNKLLGAFNKLYSNKDKTFGNGRLARNIFEKAIERQANRIAGIVPLTEELLTTLTEDDVPPENLFSA